MGTLRSRSAWELKVRWRLPSLQSGLRICFLCPGAESPGSRICLPFSLQSSGSWEVQSLLAEISGVTGQVGWNVWDQLFVGRGWPVNRNSILTAYHPACSVYLWLASVSWRYRHHLSFELCHNYLLQSKNFVNKQVIFLPFGSFLLTHPSPALNWQVIWLLHRYHLNKLTFPGNINNMMR